MNFRNLQQADSIEFSYRYNVMEQAQNRSYAGKEKKRGISIIGVRINNKSDQEISFSRNLKLSTGTHDIIIVEPEIAIQELRQQVLPYAFYSLIILVDRDCADLLDPCRITKAYPVGLPFAIGNMIVAGVSNNNFRKEILRDDLYHRIIKPGEIVTGLLAVEFTYYEPIQLVVQ